MLGGNSRSILEFIPIEQGWRIGSIIQNRGVEWGHPPPPLQTWVGGPDWREYEDWAPWSEVFQVAGQGWKAMVGQGRRGCTRGESALERQEALLATFLVKFIYLFFFGNTLLSCFLHLFVFWQRAPVTEKVPTAISSLLLLNFFEWRLSHVQRCGTTVGHALGLMPDCRKAWLLVIWIFLQLL